MRYKSLHRSVLISILMVGIGCSLKKEKHAKQVAKFYEGFENGDFSRIKKTIADSLIILEGDYKMNFTKESFYEHFRWDSVFKPRYNVISIENKEKHIIATVAVHSLRYAFLKNNPLKSRHKFYFASGQISKIENFDFIDVNWQDWQKERDSLVNWIKNNEPKLDGFIHDLSMEGAMNYLKVIEMYKEGFIKKNILSQ